jgi:hypothetical protein
MTPVVGLILKPPPELSALSDQVMAPPLMSVAAAVMPTRVFAAAPSATVLTAPLLSAGVEGATSVTPMVKVCDVEMMPSLARAVMV